MIRVIPVEQGTPEWIEARLGMVTASTVKGLITPKTVKVAANAESRAIVSTLVAERINGWSDDNYVSYDMQRGHDIEPLARDLYSATYDPVTQAGLIVSDDWGFKIGYSPDGLVGDNGLIETKRHKPKDHVEIVLTNKVPDEHMAQCQTGLLVSGREWIDYLSYCGGMALWTVRVYPDPVWQEVIIEAVTIVEAVADEMIGRYLSATEGRPIAKREDPFESGVIF